MSPFIAAECARPTYPSIRPGTRAIVKTVLGTSPMICSYAPKIGSCTCRSALANGAIRLMARPFAGRATNDRVADQDSLVK